MPSNYFMKGLGTYESIDLQKVDYLVKGYTTNISVVDYIKERIAKGYRYNYSEVTSFLKNINMYGKYYPEDCGIDYICSFSNNNKRGLLGFLIDTYIEFCTEHYSQVFTDRDSIVDILENKDSSGKIYYHAFMDKGGHIFPEQQLSAFMESDLDKTKALYKYTVVNEKGNDIKIIVNKVSLYSFYECRKGVRAYA